MVYLFDLLVDFLLPYPSSLLYLYFSTFFWPKYKINRFFIVLKKITYQQDILQMFTFEKTSTLQKWEGNGKVYPISEW